ncbi:hypothetical protein AB6A40_000160 [Gnathostoma spinigerum]|uniref:Uncharacterized protein n=1 Tax=Gnathostoma spinigerum TaxID=75299 RepID=A0ABD6E7V4_9BILA
MIVLQSKFNGADHEEKTCRLENSYEIRTTMKSDMNAKNVFGSNRKSRYRTNSERSCFEELEWDLERHG